MRGSIFVAAVLVVACNGSGGPTAPEVAQSTAALETASWTFRPESTLRQPTRDGGGWFFDFPLGGNVNYVYTACCKDSTVGKTLTASFSIDAADASYAQSDSGDLNPATVHVFLQRRGDDMTSDFGRWWSAGRELTTDGSGVFVFTVPLDWHEWTSVYGHRDQVGFEDAASHLGNVGFTFGGQFFFGHGVGLRSGAARFRLLTFGIN